VKQRRDVHRRSVAQASRLSLDVELVTRAELRLDDPGVTLRGEEPKRFEQHRLADVVATRHEVDRAELREGEVLEGPKPLDHERPEHRADATTAPASGFHRRHRTAR